MGLGRIHQEVIYALLVILGILCIVEGILLTIAVKRLFQFQAVIQHIDDSVFMLVSYCKKLERQALISDAPEVVRFHTLVKNVAQNFMAVVHPEQVEEEGLDG